MQGESVQMTGHPVRSQPPASQWRWKQSLLPSAGLPQEVTAGPPDSVSLLQNGSAALDRRQWRGNDSADRLAGKATISGLHLRSEVLRSLRHYLLAQSRGHHTTNHPEDRDMDRGSAWWSSLKGRERAIVSQINIETVSKASFGKLVRDRMESLGFSKHIVIDTILNWTELKTYSCYLSLRIYTVWFVWHWCVFHFSKMINGCVFFSQSSCCCFASVVFG